MLQKFVHNRLLPVAENLDHETQCGSRPSRGCANAVFPVKSAMKKRREHSKETWIVFLDLVKAFDRVPCNLLWSVLERFGFSPKIIRILKSLHRAVNVKFTVGTFTHVLKSIIGVKQGDILGPILFTIFIAAIMITWRKCYNRPVCVFRTKNDFVMTGHRPTTRGENFALEDSEYADNTAILFNSRNALEVYLHYDSRNDLEVYLHY